MKYKHFLTTSLPTNTYLVYDDKGTGVIVDPGDSCGKMENFIRENKLTVPYILLTHGHADHMGGVGRYRQLLPDVKVVACKEEVDILGNADDNASDIVFGHPVTCKADILVGDMDSMQVGDLDILFLETPGHTEGGMSIYIDRTILLTGDTLFRNSVGRTDLPGGSMRQITRSIREKLFTLPGKTVVLPGHGFSTTIADERESNPFVRP